MRVGRGIDRCRRRVEHYEIAAYGAVSEIATTLGRDLSTLPCLQETLAEERRKLTKNLPSLARRDQTRTLRKWV
jgi:ferritin-like metal-binding protein YciE